MTEGATALDCFELTQLEACSATYVDRKNWDGLVADCLAEIVDLDYTALRPTSPAGPMLASDIVAEWRSRTGPIPAVQHHFSNVVVDVDGDAGCGTASGVSTHRRRDSYDAERLWQIGAYYDFGLTRMAGGWRVSAVRIHPLWQRTEAL